MLGATIPIGAALVVAGLVLLAIEVFHPGALLLIPGSILLVAGILTIFAPGDFLNNFVGWAIVIIAAVLGALIEIPYYRWVAPSHRPMSTTSRGLEDEIAIVIAPVIPNTLKGKVRVKSEIWSAKADHEIPVGTKVRVVHGEGVSLTVVPVDEPPPAS